MARLFALLALASPLTYGAAQTPLRTYSDAFIQQYRRTDPKVDYTVTVPASRAAYIVEMRIANVQNPATIVIPNWAPGAYRIMKSEENIADVSARTAAGQPLDVVKAGHISWTVHTQDATEIIVRYSTGLRRPAQWARANNRWFLRQASGLIDGPRTFMYLDGWKLTPSHVRFRLPAGWRIATGLVPTTDSTVYWAPSFDVLIDSPVLLGRFVDYRFTAGGVPHRAVVDLGGARPLYNQRAFVDMLRRICETSIAIFGNAPFKDYTFIYAGVGGGLEHLNSTTIGFNHARMRLNPRAHEEVTAHEFFHTWNVKRLRPAELGPFDYTQPVHTVNLWMSEGVTDYYTLVILARAGLDTPAEFARKIAASITNHRNNAGRLVVSPERASWTVWDSPEVNQGHLISYYLQGELLGFLLDLAIRDSTDNAKSLDDVMRYLFDQHSGERGFTSEDLVKGVQAVTDRDFRTFWREYVSGTTEIPWNDYLQAAGWQVAFSEQPAVDIGIGTFVNVQGGPVLAAPVPGGAAAAAGLLIGDKLVRVNGRPIGEPGDVPSALRLTRVGSRVTVEVLRDSLPQTITFRAQPATRARAELQDLGVVSERMRRIRDGILTGR